VGDAFGRKTGAAMSDKQMARAAVEGQLVTIYTTAVNLPKVEGYVVGSDDYHWLVATITEFVLLVHKTAPVVVFTGHTLDREPESVQEWVTQVGQHFWEYCRRTFLGVTSHREQEKNQ
jgi:hypothetical protein